MRFHRHVFYDKFLGLPDMCDRHLYNPPQAQTLFELVLLLDPALKLSKEKLQCLDDAMMLRDKLPDLGKLWIYLLR